MVIQRTDSKRLHSQQKVKLEQGCKVVLGIGLLSSMPVNTAVWCSSTGLGVTALENLGLHEGEIACPPFSDRKSSRSSEFQREDSCSS